MSEFSGYELYGQNGSSSGEQSSTLYSDPSLDPSRSGHDVSGVYCPPGFMPTQVAVSQYSPLQEYPTFLSRSSSQHQRQSDYPRGSASLLHEYQNQQFVAGLPQEYQNEQYGSVHQPFRTDTFMPVAGGHPNARRFLPISYSSASYAENPPHGQTPMTFSMQEMNQLPSDHTTQTPHPPNTMIASDSAATEPYKPARDACENLLDTLKLSCQVHTAVCNFCGEKKSKQESSSTRSRRAYAESFCNRWIKGPLLPSDIEKGFSDRQRRVSSAAELFAAMDSDDLSETAKIMAERFGDLSLLHGQARAPETIREAARQLQTSASEQDRLQAQTILRNSVNNLTGRGQELSPVGYETVLKGLDELRLALNQFGSKRGRPKKEHTAGPGRISKARRLPRGDSTKHRRGTQDRNS